MRKWKTKIRGYMEIIWEALSSLDWEGPSQIR